MHHTSRFSMAAAVAACAALALAACSASGGVPGLDGGGPGGSAAAPSPSVPAVPASSAPSAPSAASSSAEPSATTAPTPTTAPAPAPTTSAAPTTRSTPSAKPSPSATAAPTDSDGALNPRLYGVLWTNKKNQRVDSAVPFMAQVRTPEGELRSGYSFNQMEVNYKCPAKGALRPKNGHFVRVYFLGTNRSTPAGSPDLDATAHTWTYYDKSGKKFSGQIVTKAAQKCRKPVGPEWGLKVHHGKIGDAELVFDLPATDGFLQHSYQDLGSWRFPVKNANPKYVPLYKKIERIFAK